MNELVEGRCVWRLDPNWTRTKKGKHFTREKWEKKMGKRLTLLNWVWRLEKRENLLAVCLWDDYSIRKKPVVGSPLNWKGLVEIAHVATCPVIWPMVTRQPLILHFLTHNVQKNCRQMNTYSDYGYRDPRSRCTQAWSERKSRNVKQQFCSRKR